MSLSFYLAIFNLEVVNAFEVVKGPPSHTGLESVESIKRITNNRRNTSRKKDIKTNTRKF